MKESKSFQSLEDWESYVHGEQGQRRDPFNDPADNGRLAELLADQAFRRIQSAQHEESNDQIRPALET